MTKIMEKPIPSFIIVLIGTLLISNILAPIFQSIFNVFVSAELSLYISSFLAAIIVAILYIYIFKFKKLFNFSNFKLALILGSPAILQVISNLIDPAFAVPTSIIVLVTVIIGGISSGILEEVIFRGVVISYLMKMFKGSNVIIPVVIGSALLFGILHILNVFAGAPLDISILQFFSAFSFGIIFAAVYLRTGNLWASIILHALNNILSFCCTSVNAGGVVQVGFTLNFLTIYTIVVSIICIIVGFYYVRSSKHDEILELWEEKWAN